MNAKIYGMIALMLSIFTNFNALAQQLEDTALAKPVSLLAEDAEIVDLESFDPTISFYVQNLNLSPEQLDQAQRISEAEQEKKENLLRQIEALRKEAYNLEAGSLIAFEAILDDAQRATFQELRAGVEENFNKETEKVKDTTDFISNNQ
ncbi:MAG: hypothetical protein IJ218_02530 [Alphaproteobacteria bacterium]|nr:hypothetical protein [Alphaproteobacteria bacterium]